MVRIRWRQWTLRIVGSAVVAIVGYRLLAEALVARADATAARDPSTGILRGAEERTLGPAHAERAVLFVHGCVGAGNNFHRLPEQFADAGWRVRVMRLPGHGTSPRDFETTTVDALRDAVRSEAKNLRAAGAKTLILVGHSMGGTLSTLTAAEMPIDGLILGGAYFGITHHWYYGLRPETWHRAGAPLLRWVFKGRLFMLCNRAEVKPQIVSYAWVPTKGLTTLQRLGDLANQPSVLANVRCPVLMLHAPGDHAAAFDAAQRALEGMGATSKRFVALPKSNHHVFWDFEWETVEQEAMAFAKLLTLGARPLESPVGK